MSQAESNQDTILDHAVWRNLPEDLLLIVLSKLRFLSLVQFRSVCKKWNKYIITRGQGLSPGEYQVSVPVPVKCDPGKFCAKQLTVYNSKTSKWEKLSLAFTGRMPGRETSGSYTLAATDGGLLCFRDSTFASFVVCNPLTKRWRFLIPPSSCLPPSPNPWDVCAWDCRHNSRVSALSRLSDYILVGLVVDSQIGTYKLVVAGIQENGKTLVYNSALDLWHTGAPVLLPPPLFNRQFRCVQYNGKSVSLNGNLYWLISEGHDSMSSVSVVKYDLQKDFWLATNAAKYPRGSLVRNYLGTMSVMTLDRARIPRYWGGRQWFLQVHETESRFCLISRRISEYSIYKIEGMPRFSDEYNQEYHCCVGQGDFIFIVYKILAGSSQLGYRLVNFDAFMKKYDDLPHLRNPPRQDQSLKWPLMYSDMVETETWWGFIPSLRAIV
ncbi:hypothetical protein Mapa_011925 [Marchantia paleacea]|nr:hypothetical protein Mapa_011925 [Marchantia paleacea]